MMVSCATEGFGNYNNSNRILDYIRTSCGEKAPWADFKKYVDKFLGDLHRSQFTKAIMHNDNGLAAMTTAAVLNPEDPEYINYVQNQFKPKGKKGKGKGKNQKSKGKNNQQFSNPPNSKGKGGGKNNNNNNTKKCAWCGSNHHSHQCKTHGDGKWDTKQCNRCKGFGHPQAACITPMKKKEKPSK